MIDFFKALARFVILLFFLHIPLVTAVIEPEIENALADDQFTTLLFYSIPIVIILTTVSISLVVRTVGVFFQKKEGSGTLILKSLLSLIVLWLTYQSFFDHSFGLELIVIYPFLYLVVGLACLFFSFRENNFTKIENTTYRFLSILLSLASFYVANYYLLNPFIY